MTAGAALSLRFERDNPCNTTIVDPDGNRFYTVATDFPKPDKPVTHLHDGVGNLIAEWTWRDARSDLLTIRDRPETPASVWLKKSIIPFRDDVTFQDDAGVEYDVYIHVPRSSCLVDRENPPVVPSTLLDESVEPIRDFIAISFLLLERRRREKETSIVNQARASATFGQFGAF